MLKNLNACYIMAIETKRHHELKDRVEDSFGAKAAQAREYKVMSS